jgi:hypothetical protein
MTFRTYWQMIAIILGAYCAGEIVNLALMGDIKDIKGSKESSDCFKSAMKREPSAREARFEACLTSED